MDDTWKDWSRIAKERFEEHLEREHASDFTDGNVDYHVSEGLLAEENLVTGDIVLNVPPLYWEDGYEEYFLDVGYHALNDTIKYQLDRMEQEVIRDFEVLNPLKF